ncbi:TonB-dependent receptor [Acetobacter orientalis]|uniref:TonB-dependent receptor n=1 Tax=Acetobacter orientalis TaxID=146474 RepID=A0A2Z5ZGF1_9PROT|nr:TonB-dependent receptor [Acetobacter orientalis]
MISVRSVKSVLPVFLLASAAVTSGAAAQTLSVAENTPDTENEPSKKQTSKASSKPEIVVVTATGRSSASASTKTRTPIIESPQTITIVNREEIELRASPSVADALAYVAGVQAQPQGVDSRVDEVSVRGFGAGGFSSNNNFVDGLRLPSGGQWTRTSFDPFALQQIEVLKGPSGALYGQTAPGGVVNLVTKRPTAKSEGEFFIQGSGFTNLDNGQGQASGDVSGKLNKSGTVLGRVVALAKYGGTQVNSVNTGRYYFSPSLTWHITPKQPGRSWRSTSATKGGLRSSFCLPQAHFMRLMAAISKMMPILANQNGIRLTVTKPLSGLLLSTALINTLVCAIIPATLT